MVDGQPEILDGEAVKTPRYETSAGALAALLATRSFVWSTLYTILLAGGGTLRYAASDTDFTYGGNTWTKGGPFIDQGGQSGSGQQATAHWKVGLDVDTWQFAVFPRPVDPVTGAVHPDTIGNVPWLQAARGGVLDGAVVIVDRAYLPAWPPFPRPIAIAPTGVVNIFTGRVAAIDVGRSAAYISVNSHLELLDAPMPRNVFQAGCHHTLFDHGCTLSAVAYAAYTSASASSTTATILSSAAAPPGSNTYALGRIVFTSGLNATFSRSVRQWAPGVFTLIAPMPFQVSPGDTFIAYPGCDKKLSTCGAFGNTANFGGQPFIPAPEVGI